MDVLILAAGFGTRLYPLTHDTPKALIDINGKPIIEYTIKKIEEIADVDTIYILSNNKFYNNFTEWLDNFKSSTNKKIKILNNGVDKESEAKGVLKDLKYSLNLMDTRDTKELLILGSDNLYFLDLNKVIALGRKNNSGVIAIRKTTKELIKKYSAVLLDKNKKLISFQEKPQNPKSNLASIFCYYLTKKEINIMKKEIFGGERISEKARNPTNIVEFLYNQRDFYGYCFTEPWYDIGCLEELTNARKNLG